MEINGVKLLKKGVRFAGKYYPVHYDRSIDINGKKMLTIYAQDHLRVRGLSDALNAVNQSESREDYFETDRARFYEGAREYDALSAFMAEELGK